MKESNGIKVSNHWKKALYSSVVLSAIFVGGQYVSTVHASADTVANTSENQPVKSQVLFDDVANVFNDSENNTNLTNPVVNGYVGQQLSLVNAKTTLQDLGFDVSDIPDTYTPTSSAAKIYSLTAIGIKNEPSTLNGQYKLVFEIFDQNGNYIESKYDSTNNADNYDSTPIVQQLQQEKDKFVLNANSTVNGKIDIPALQEGDNVVKVSVTAPTHILQIDYVNQNGVSAFTTNKPVTNFGHTGFDDDKKSYGEIKNNAELNVNPDQPYVANNRSTATVNVTTTQSFNPISASNFFYGYPDADDVTTVSDANGSQNPNGDAYYTTVNVVGSDGKNIVSLIVGSNKSQIIGAYGLGPDDNNYNSPVDFDNVTDLPDLLDLTKGPYTFHSTDTLADLQAQSSAAAQSQQAAEQQSASSSQASQSNQASAPVSQQPTQSNGAGNQSQENKTQSVQTSSASNQAQGSAQASSTPSSAQSSAVQSSAQSSAAQSSAKPSSSAAQPAQQTQPVVKAAPAATRKPTIAEYKSVIKAANKSKRIVNSDAKKLKALKKKKHATKKQKAAYKKLQAQSVKDNKNYKQLKALQTKLAKYFKNVAIIKSDNKKIKSLTSQMKKLKKSHSKASKKKYAKAAKALKKANSSLKAATKFVNNYK